MQRSSKQVLLKYSSVDRKKIEDDALMFRVKTLLRWFFVTALLFFPFMFYFLHYFVANVPNESEEVELDGWGPNTNRSVPLYIIPNNDTAIIDGSHLCSQPMQLLIVVCSAANNTLQRTTIRKTWGNVSSSDYKLAFLLGTTNRTSLQEAIQEESATYNDIIQENFFDSYNNLTLKSVMLLKFVKRHCSQVNYIFKSDDDMFTYIPNLLALISVIQKENLTNVLIGKLICEARPIHRTMSKWYAPKYMFRERVYPHYLSGTGYLMDRNTALQLFEAAMEIPYLHLEDVFVTGLCARKAHIKPRHHSGFSYIRRPLNPCSYLRDQNVITSHRIKVDDMKLLWLGLKNISCRNANNSILPQLDFLKTVVGRKSRCS